MTEKILYFATGNAHKVEEVQRAVQTSEFKIVQYKIDRVEPQDEDPVQVAIFSLKYLLQNQTNVPSPVFVEDAGLFIDALNGFPGVFSAYALKTLGNEGILKLLTGVTNRQAQFRSTIACITENNRIITFQGITKGVIVNAIRGKAWGFNPIFMPMGSNLTYAELGDSKAEFSHRIRSLKQLLDFLRQNHTS